MEACPSCGAENPVGTWRCASCGKLLPASSSAAPIPNQSRSLVNEIALGVFVGLMAWSIVSGIVGAIIWYAVNHN